ncbi:Quinone-dependent D-lactate dehydrogenase [Paraburkholderia hiiakae]|uniref:D-lactate dehydrogenase n=1 Tax=Paraburkholderia hiiakae TaxID=1081782 RepID=A0ABM8NZI5_9BURK|nr:D-lactate dehydrogenase [Paraburkholderia hiiakae]CAD6550688.1 Quinone-dependent D-lactate dehydrogenase [Paraburkholderia hiiakae]
MSLMELEMSSKDLLAKLRGVLAEADLLDGEDEKVFYTKGFRVGHGKALAVALPRTLSQLWSVLKVCVDNDAIILMQASNTGVTGGSTPNGEDYDRELIIVSTRRLKGVQVIDDAKQVIAFPGSTLTELENALKPYKREPHSVIGSSCIGASVVGGICNNSGGSLIRRGPAFTEKSLFARVDENGQLQLVNNLGIRLGEDPEEILDNLTSSQYTIGDTPDWDGKLWAENYAEKLRDVAANSPARYNGNPEYLHDSAGCAGKLAVFAVRLPTFDTPLNTTSFYVGTNNEAELVQLRLFLLTSLSKLPIQAEYMHKGALDLSVRYAKHIYKAIRLFGPEKIPELTAQKANWDKLVRRVAILPDNTVDKAIQITNVLTPMGLAGRIPSYMDLYEHHLVIKTDGGDAEELAALLERFFSTRTGEYFKCDEEEARDAFLVRFTVGACTICYCDSQGIDTNERLLAFDVALRRNDTEWRLKLPPHLQEQVLLDSCCGHFFCFVNHQDYILKPGCNAVAFKKDVLSYLETRGAKYPAEHNVGNLYHASESYQAQLKKLDPTNSFNPGIGKTSKRKYWQ